MRIALLVSVIALTLGWTATGQELVVQQLGGPAGAPPSAVEVKPESLCTIEGKVVNANTGEPVPKAMLTLRGAEPQRSPASPPPSFSTTSGTDGKFAMKDVPPGSYRLHVMRNGFVMSEYGSRGPMRSGTTLKLEPAQKMTAVDFKLTPHGIVSGRIVDEDGEPLSWVQVSMVRYRFANGRKQLVPMGGSSTNDLGEFRIFGIAPGRYFLSAAYNNRMMWDGTQDRSAAGAPEQAYLPTYFPGSTDPSGASAFDIGPGQHISGIDMRLSKMRSTRVRGRVVNMTGVRQQGIMVNLAPKDSGMYSLANRAMAQGPQGRFEFRGVAPGSYVLTAVIPDGQVMYSARQAMDVGAENIENLTITLAPGMQVGGNLGVEGSGAAAFDRTAVRLMLMPANSDGMMMFGPAANDRVKDDGSFRFPNVSPDRYQIRVMGLSDGYYLKSVRVGDQLAADDVIDLSSGAAPALQLTVAEGAALVEGAVSNDKQEPVTGATVVLIPEKESRRSRYEFVKSATTDQNGRFTVKNLDPGDYRAYAWEDIEMGSWLDPDVIKPVESKAKKITLRERGKESLDLRVIRNE